MRPLWMEFQEDTTTFGIEDQFILGDAILVHPISQAGATSANVYFPGEDVLWYEIFKTYSVYKGPGYQTIPAVVVKIPVFQQGCTIVPKKERARRSSFAMAKNPYILIVALDSKGEAKGQLYVDDGKSLEYQKGNCQSVKVTMSTNVLKSKFVDIRRFATNESIEKIVIAGLHRAPSRVEVSGGHLIEFQYDAGKQLLVQKPTFHIYKN